MEEHKWRIAFLASSAQIERLPRLLRRLATSVRSSPERRLQDQYLDTNSRLLMRAGVSCRLRRTGKCATLTLDSLTPDDELLGDRADLTENLSERDWSWPGPLPGHDVRTRLAPLSRRLDVHGLFALKREFRVYDVWTRDGARLEIGAGRIHVVGSTPGSEIHRIEVDSRAGLSEALGRFASELRRGLKLKPASESDFEHGLRVSGLAETVPSLSMVLRIRPQTPVRTVAALALTAYLRQMRWHAPGTRLGINSECLHDMRVSVRRMRAILRLFRAALPSGTAAKVAVELRWLGQSLGAVRDLDVHLQECTAWRHRPEAERKAAATCRFEMIRHRKRAYDALRSDLSSPRFGALVAVCRTLIGQLRRPAAAGSGAIAKEGALLLEPELRRILKAGRAIGPDTPDEVLHRLRVRCKRLRYACETLKGIYGKPVSKMAQRLAVLQDTLGAHHDAMTAQTLIGRAIADAGAGAPGGADVARPLGLCAAGWREEQSIRRAAFPKVWKAFDRKKARRAFLKAVARVSLEVAR